MNVLFVYRHPSMGFSIGKVFHPIEKELQKHVNIDSIYMPVSNYSLLGMLKNIRVTRNQVKKKRYDVVHIVGTENYLIPFLWRQNVVVTVHDFASLEYKGSKIKSFLKKMLFVKTLKLAKIVTFISQKTAEECSSYVNIKENRKKVVYDAVDDSLVFSSHKFNAEKPVFLHIGVKANKNLIRSIEAMKGLSAHLRIIGKLDEKVQKILDASRIEYSNGYNLSDEEIFDEYKKCDIVNFPSLYEGFGMPIVEGNAVGRVVVTSNRSPMNEIANGAAVLVNPEDVASIRKGYLEAIKNHDYYIKKGTENAKHFQCPEIARQYLSIYEFLMRGKPL